MFGEKVKYDDVEWMFFINIDAITAAKALSQCSCKMSLSECDSESGSEHHLMTPLLIVPHLIELQNWFTTVNKTDAVNEVSDCITLCRRMHPNVSAGTSADAEKQSALC